MISLSKDYIEDERVWYAIENSFALEECIQAGATVECSIDFEAIMKEDPILIFNNLRVSTLAQRTLELFLKVVPDYEAHLDDLFLRSTDLARDTLFRYLSKNKLLKKNITHICEPIIQNPLNFPDAMTWLSRQIINKKFPKTETTPKLIDIFQLLVNTAITLKSLKQTEAVKKMTKLFTSSLIDKVLEKTEVEQARGLLKTVQDGTVLPYSFKENMIAQIRERFSDLFTQIKPIFTTRIGLIKYEKEYNELMNVKIPENQRRIGEALSFGDISENAELDAARDLEWKLAKKADEMQKNLKRAQEIDFEKVGTAKVEVGCCAHLEDEDGKKLTYTILGPWDVNIDQGIISFMSPIAEALLTHEAGEKVHLPNGDYTILKIEVAEV